MEDDYITVSQIRRQQDLWRSLALNSENVAIVERKLEDLFFAFGHKINLSARTRAPLLEALKVIAEAPPISNADNDVTTDQAAKRLFFIVKISAPVWRRGYRMDGTKVAAERMEGVEEVATTTPRRSRSAEKAQERGESRKRALSPQARHESAKKPRSSSLTVVDSLCPTRIWNPSVTVIKASAPEERGVIGRLGSVMKAKTRADKTRLNHRWIDLEQLNWSELVDELSLSGWLQKNQEIWWSSESAAEIDVTSTQSEINITGGEDFGKAIWDSMTEKFPERCGPKVAGNPKLPKGPTPSFTIVIQDKN